MRGCATLKLQVGWEVRMMHWNDLIALLSTAIKLAQSLWDFVQNLKKAPLLAS
jgi:hypothetical protein